MLVSRAVSGGKQRKTKRFAESASLFAVPMVRPDFDPCPTLKFEPGKGRGCSGLNGEQNPYPLRT